MTPPEPPAPGATAFSQRLLSAALLATVVVLLWKLSDLLVVAFGGVVLAVALRALADLLVTRLRVPQRWSLLAALTLIVLLLAGVTWLAGGPLIEQLVKLRERLPAALETMTGWIHAHPLGRLGLQAWRLPMACHGIASPGSRASPSACWAMRRSWRSWGSSWPARPAPTAAASCG